MDSLFEPRTFSTDWEVMAIDRLGRPLSTELCDAFAGALSAEIDLPIHTDWGTIEFGLGVNKSLREFEESVIRLTDRASELVREFDLDLFPAASQPLNDIFNASHVHVGTLFDEAKGMQLGNQLLPYVPAFGALAANAPFSGGCTGAFKSYRIHHHAHGCARPGTIYTPETAQSTWGADAAPKLYGYPTLEVRIIDCASSRRFLVELATFIAAYVHHQGTRLQEAPPSPEQYRECMTNRWAAAKHGLQATFIHNGSAVPVVEMLGQMLDECEPALTQLGAKRKDLPLIEIMLRKRVCQADFGRELSHRYPDPHALLSTYAKLLRHWEIVDEWLENADTLEPAPVPDEERVLSEHLKAVGEGTHFYRIREVMNYPPTVADAVIATMVQRGWIHKEVTMEHGPLLHRRK